MQPVQLEAVEENGDSLVGEAGPRVEVSEAVIGAAVREVETAQVGGVSNDGAPGGIELGGVVENVLEQVRMWRDLKIREVARYPNF